MQSRGSTRQGTRGQSKDSSVVLHSKPRELSPSIDKVKEQFQRFEFPEDGPTFSNELIPSIFVNRTKEKFDEDQRIPSPIKNRLEENPKVAVSVETVARTQQKGKRTQVEEKKEVPKEFDSSLITSQPKRITLIDKLQQLSYITKPRADNKHPIPKKLELKTRISVNE